AARLPGRHAIWVLGAAPAQAPAAAGFGVLWTWSDTPAEPAGEGEGAGPGRSSLLASASARRWGVVPLTDLTAAVLSELGVAGGAPLGRGAGTGAESYPWSRLAPAGASLEAVLAANHSGRVYLIQGYVLALIIT